MLFHYDVPRSAYGANSNVELDIGLWRVDTRICAKRGFDGPPAEVKWAHRKHRSGSHLPLRRMTG